MLPADSTAVVALMIADSWQSILTSIMIVVWMDVHTGDRAERDVFVDRGARRTSLSSIRFDERIRREGRRLVHKL